MKVYLAGFNVDTSVLEEMQRDNPLREDVTPEVLSAAYARISRDPRAINEIRKSAREEVERTRKSNKAIIFKMGHHSVAEHAVFNLDILGVSRYAMEELEKFRLCSYTEKSQRYITLDNDFVVPQEIKGTQLEGKFVDMIKVQNEAYFVLYDKLLKHVFEKHSDLASDPKNKSLLEGWAKEDARYITALATESQVGLTINARNLELMLRRFASHNIEEIRNLGRQIYDEIVDIAPSIIVFNEANNRDLKTYPTVRAECDDLVVKAASMNSDVQLVDCTSDADQIIATALLHSSSDMPFEQCREIVGTLSKDKTIELFKAAWQNMQLFDSMLREFEYVNLTYNIELSSACFGQLKRHRMSTITSQDYDPKLDLTIPDNIKEIEMDDYFIDIANKSAQLYEEIKQSSPLAAPYILTNAHKKRVLMRTNLRELYHISRLREDAHAQWDVQNIARKMSACAKDVMPLSCGLIGGKDRYSEVYQSIFGSMPQVTEVKLPGERKIRDEVSV